MRLLLQSAGEHFVCREFLICGFSSFFIETASFHEILAPYRNRNVTLIGGGRFSVETEMAWEFRPPPICFDHIPLRKVLKAECKVKTQGHGCYIRCYTSESSKLFSCGKFSLVM